MYLREILKTSSAEEAGHVLTILNTQRALSRRWVTNTPKTPTKEGISSHLSREWLNSSLPYVLKSPVIVGDDYCSSAAGGGLESVPKNEVEGGVGELSVGQG